MGEKTLIHILEVRCVQYISETQILAFSLHHGNAYTKFQRMKKSNVKFSTHENANKNAKHKVGGQNTVHGVTMSRLGNCIGYMGVKQGYSGRLCTL